MATFLGALVFVLLAQLNLQVYARDLLLAGSSLSDIPAIVASHRRILQEDCASGATSFCSDKADGLYASPCSASAFLACSQQRTTLHNCKPGFSWDDSSLTCAAAPLLIPALGQQANLATVNPGQDLTQSSAVCQDRVDGMYPSSESPSDFVHCTRGAAFTLHCNRDLVWDSSCSCCNLPHSAEDPDALDLGRKLGRLMDDAYQKR